jgi:multidrug efflux system membrane fusion protein
VAAAEPTPASQAFRRFVVAFIGLMLVAYFGFFGFVGYTDDAYIKSDLIRVAPEVSGTIATVNVRDNNRVEAGTVLLTIDPAPFELLAAAKRDRVASAQPIGSVFADDCL